jgi:DNA-binding GntR family transcriptional regulator
MQPGGALESIAAAYSVSSPRHGAHAKAGDRRLSPRTAHSARRKPVSSLAAEARPELQKDRAYDRILMDIILSELPPGAQLDEDDLARRYGEGLAALRDALGRLALEGMVDRRPRAGTFVAPLDLVELHHEYEARRLIEPDCAALAALNGGPEDIKAIVEAFAQGADAAKARDFRALVRMDQRFHAAIGRASGNSSLERVLIPLQYKASRFWIYTSRESPEKELLSSIRSHLEVATLIANGDAHGARNATLAVMGPPPNPMRINTRFLGR